MTDTASNATGSKGLKRTFVGHVLSDKMDKTVVVGIDTLVKHPQYGKFLKRRVKYMAHDEVNQCKNGDKVVIVETRPHSARKRWRIKEVLEQAK